MGDFCFDGNQLKILLINNLCDVLPGFSFAIDRWVIGWRGK